MNPNQIPRELRERIMRNRFSKSTFYRKISEYQNAYNVPSGYAALKLASDLKISIKKWVDDEYFATMRGHNDQKIILQPPTTTKSKTEPTPELDVDLSRVKDVDLQKILVRDVKELNIAMSQGVQNTSKTCMLLCGSITETILLERLTRDSTLKTAALGIGAAKNPPYASDIHKWTLYNLIEASDALGLLPKDSRPQIGQLKDWRNLVHPGREIQDAKKKGIRPTKGRANLAIKVLEFVSTELK